MLPEIGHYALLLGFSFALLGGVVPWWGIVKRETQLIGLAWPLSYGAFGFTLLAIVLLAVSFALDDFSVAYIAQHSNSQLPWYFKVAAVWGGHEGSFLFWVLALAGWAAVVARCSRGRDEVFSAKVLVILAQLVALFSVYLLVLSNPFLRLESVPLEGRDLNPMLQDVGLIFHPPMLYLGYVGFAVSFAYAIAALLTKPGTAPWAGWARPWTAAAWAFLTGGIVLGSWWAYYELGWGGWWFWDPVENASFMPWLTGTALMHSLIITERRQALTNWSLLLAIFTFSLSLLGTFIVRSGVLTSVHAFAVDPTRGLALLGLLGAILLVALLLFAVKNITPLSARRFGFLSQPALFMGGNSLLAVITLTILLGTFYPLVFQALGWGKISVGAPYFNQIFVPLSFLLFALMGLGVLIYQKSGLSLMIRGLAPLSLAVVLGGILSVWFEQGINLNVWLALTFALWIAFTAIEAHCMQANRQSVKRSVDRTWAMVLAHLGVSVAVIGATLVSHYSIETSHKMGPGDVARLGAYQFTYQNTELRIGPNYTAARARISVERDGQPLTVMYPERRHYTVRTMTMSEPGIQGYWHGDLYITLSEKLDRHDYAVRIQYKPYVRWLWFGGILMMIGGSIAVVGHFTRTLIASQVKSGRYVTGGNTGRLRSVLGERVEGP
ncbi:heme lyase CcmF/NrfE family subunit [Photobacterium atrarenae]|uniref:Heme lyase CcmF/NrfE family subunit n=1 Tax=Photobacterium atrarenae TaxID=865757 RepID=A0ABY5GDM1_9GAMM|nr:heme lyase CcmF/NrfE family subunit [Photobacterium atrarenae]UTV26697.1 heme lyase CcmF/NrfE family subunit [Photobacterium atrarenae]